MEIKLQNECSVDQRISVLIEYSIKAMNDVVLEQLLTNNYNGADKTNEVEYFYKNTLTKIKSGEISGYVVSGLSTMEADTHEIHYKGTVQDFITKNRAKGLVRLIKPIYAREVALFRLMTDGYLMPVKIANPKKGVVRLSVDIHFSSEELVDNIPIYIELDMMPFEKYIVVKIPAKDSDVL